MQNNAKKNNNLILLSLEQELSPLSPWLPSLLMTGKREKAPLAASMHFQSILDMSSISSILERSLLQAAVFAAVWHHNCSFLGLVFGFSGDFFFFFERGNFFSFLYFDLLLIPTHQTVLDQPPSPPAKVRSAILFC